MPTPSTTLTPNDAQLVHVYRRWWVTTMRRSERAIDAVAAWLEARLAWRPNDDFVWQARHRGKTSPMSANSCRLASFGALYTARSPDGVLDSGGTANPSPRLADDSLRPLVRGYQRLGIHRATLAQRRNRLCRSTGCAKPCPKPSQLSWSATTMRPTSASWLARGSTRPRPPGRFPPCRNRGRLVRCSLRHCSC
jgi:hypothetical protein